MMKIVVALLLLAFPAAAAEDLPVEQTKKNIKVLQGMKTSQLIPAMAFMANSLGVTCAHCHTKEYESDEKPAKERARSMITMMRAINEANFGGKTTVTCNTCHRGHIKPMPTPDLANAGWETHTADTPPAMLTPEQAMAQWPAPTVTRREIHGTVERFNGRDPAKSAPFTLIVEGSKITYNTELSHPPEATRALALYLVQKPDPARLAGEQWQITPQKVTRYRELATPLGNLPERVDYTDFRDTPAGRIPFRTQWSRADYRVTYTVDAEAPAPH